jgi:hypothetical protein
MEDVRIDKAPNVSNSVIQIHPAHQPTITKVNGGPCWEIPLAPRSIRKPDLDTRGWSVQIDLEGSGSGRRGRSCCGRSNGATRCRLRGRWARCRVSQSVTLTREWAWRRRYVVFPNAVGDTELYWLANLHVQLLRRSVSASRSGEGKHTLKSLTQS